MKEESNTKINISTRMIWIHRIITLSESMGLVEKVYCIINSLVC